MRTASARLSAGAGAGTDCGEAARRSHGHDVCLAGPGKNRARQGDNDNRFLRCERGEGKQGDRGRRAAVGHTFAVLVPHRDDKGEVSVRHDTARRHSDRVALAGGSCRCGRGAAARVRACAEGARTRGDRGHAGDDKHENEDEDKCLTTCAPHRPSSRPCHPCAARSYCASCSPLRHAAETLTFCEQGSVPTWRANRDEGQACRRVRGT